MIVAVINCKGGTGKTTTSVNLSAAWAALGFRVLLIDLDAQANASLSLGVEPANLFPSAMDMLFDDVPIESVIRSTSTTGLDLVTGVSELASSDLILANMPDREKLLAQTLNPASEKYDFVICDCPPAMSMLSVNAVVAADRYVVPISPEYLALEGLITLLSTISRMKASMDIKAELLGILFTMVNLDRLPTRRREMKIQLKIIRLVQQQYGTDVFQAFVPRDVRLSEAAAHGQTILEFAPNSKVATQHIRVADEVLRRCGVTRQADDSMKREEEGYGQ